MSNPRHDHDLALLAAGYDTGFWDEYGRPRPGPMTSPNGGPSQDNQSPSTPAKNPSNQPDPKDQPLHHVQGLDLDRAAQAQHQWVRLRLLRRKLRRGAPIWALLVAFMFARSIGARPEEQSGEGR